MTQLSMTSFGSLPALRMVAADGAQATVTLYGGHLVSWRTADGQERLFCSSASARDGRRAIRGGVPVIFPQFGARGTGMRHGFARICTWRVARSGPDGGTEFELDASDLPPAVAQEWPHPFTLRLRVALTPDGLDLTLTVRNTGQHAFPFSAALHTYYALEQLGLCAIEGLRHGRFSDHLEQTGVQDEAALRFTEKLDRVYEQVPGALTLRDGAHALRLEQDGFTDVVVWNPGAVDAAALSDLADAEYQRFVCIEPALIAPNLLAAGAEWSGRHGVRLMTN